MLFWRLEGFHFRWLKIKVIDTAFPTLFQPFKIKLILGFYVLEFKLKSLMNRMITCLKHETTRVTWVKTKIMMIFNFKIDSDIVPSGWFICTGTQDNHSALFWCPTCPETQIIVTKLFFGFCQSPLLVSTVIMTCI